ARLVQLLHWRRLRPFRDLDGQVLGVGSAHHRQRECGSSYPTQGTRCAGKRHENQPPKSLSTRTPVCEQQLRFYFGWEKPFQRCEPVGTPLEFCSICLLTPPASSGIQSPEQQHSFRG